MSYACLAVNSQSRIKKSSDRTDFETQLELFENQMHKRDAFNP